MGGIPQHKGNSQLRKKLQGSLANRLKVRGVLLDYNIVCNQSPDAPPPPAEDEMKERGNSNEKEKEKRGFGSFSLPAHVADMANVLGVNVSANEKGVGLAKREREEEVLVGISSRKEEVIEISAVGQRQKAESTTPEPSAPKPHNPAPDDPRLKYMKKLKEKRGLDVSDLQKASSAAKDAKLGDGSFHVNLRDAIKAQEKKGDPNRYSSRRWLPVSGMGSLLNYIQSRSIKIGAYRIITSFRLFPHPTLNQPITSAGLLRPPELHSSYLDGDIEEYDKQLADVEFDYKFDDGDGGAGKDSKGPEFVVQDAASGLGIPREGGKTNFLMVVSSNSKVLGAARDVNSYTCYLKPANGRRCDVSTNFSISNISELRDVVDEVNGISFSNVRRVDFGIDFGGV